MVKTIRRLNALFCVCAILTLSFAGCAGKPSKDKVTHATQPPKGGAVDMRTEEEIAVDTMKTELGANTLVDIRDLALPSSVTKVYAGDKGYVIYLTVDGYQPGMEIVCGITTAGVVVNAVCLKSNETNGVEKDYGNNFVGKDAAGVDAVDTTGSATMTATAYKQAVKDAINTALVVGGADIDLRSPEEILQNNLMAALPGSGNFSKVFLTEVIEGIDAIYQGSIGFVAVIGEEFVGIDTNGKVLDKSIENAAAIEAEMGKVISSLSISNLIGVDLTAYEGIDKNVQRVTKTASGNYIVEVNGLGYAWYDDKHGYGEQRFVPIVIRVSLTPEGKIIDTLTVSHEESSGLGAACGEETYYGQFDGKTAETYQEVDGIAGATITTNGYLKAIEHCFEAVAILEEGAES